MAKLLIFAQYYFFVWAGETPGERAHIHVFRTNSKNARGAKFWLDDLSLFEPGDFTSKELRAIAKDLALYIDITRTLAAMALTGQKVKALHIQPKKTKRAGKATKSKKR